MRPLGTASTTVPAAAASAAPELKGEEREPSMRRATTSFSVPEVTVPCQPGMSAGHALDVGADRRELRLHPFIAAVQVVHAVDDGFPLGREPGQDEGHGG